MLAQILARASRLQVVTITEGMRAEPNGVYVTPPGFELSILHRVFRLRRVEPGGRLHLPIDAFFRSLASDLQHNAVGVVLSGTRSDGTMGLAAIKTAGGIAFAQDPSTAQHEGMPRGALESGAADYVMAPEAIAEQILRLSSHPFGRKLTPTPEQRKQLDALGVLLKDTFGLDLTHYKPNTIERRIQRRMDLHRMERLEDFVRLCTNDPDELARLHSELLINVTRFFRDVASFEALKMIVIPLVIERTNELDPICIWVPGCSSGEEAYSIAITFLDAFEALGVHRRLQIFATDIDPDAIQQARRGMFAPSIAADIPESRLRKYFHALEDGRYQVSARIRDVVVFSVQNLSQDAPFSRLDLVSCRNVLIYLQPHIQKKVLRMLHYSLRRESYLMLGASETIGDAAELFSLLDRKNKIYQAKHVALVPGSLNLTIGRTHVPALTSPVSARSARPVISIAHLADRRILEQYAPSGVVINENLDVLYFPGRPQRYLEQPSGVATHDILRLVRPELHLALKQAIDTVLRSDEAISVESQVRDAAGLFRPVTIVVQTLLEPETRAKCLLILFREPEALGHAVAAPIEPYRETSDERARSLQQELTLTKDYLQTTIEELERTSDDLRTSKEELQSSNEELQTTNEELETSNEELQSSNEELQTLNEELQRHTHELDNANDDLRNLLVDSSDPIVLVGLDLRIRRFSRAAERIIDLIETDVGRSVAQLDVFIGGTGIDKLVATAIEQGTLVTRELQARDHRWYAMRIFSYRAGDGVIRGAAVVFADLEPHARKGQLANAIDHYAAQFLSGVTHPLAILDQDLGVSWVNETYRHAFGTQDDDTITWLVATLQKNLAETSASGRPFVELRVVRERPGVGEESMKVCGIRVIGVANDTPLVLLAIEREHPCWMVPTH